MLKNPCKIIACLSLVFFLGISYPQCVEINACVNYPCNPLNLKNCEDLPSGEGYVDNENGRRCHCQYGYHNYQEATGCSSKLSHTFFYI